MNLVEKNYNSSAYCKSIVHNVSIYLLTYIYYIHYTYYDYDDYVIIR